MVVFLHAYITGDGTEISNLHLVMKIVNISVCTKDARIFSNYYRSIRNDCRIINSAEVTNTYISGNCTRVNFCSVAYNLCILNF